MSPSLPRCALCSRPWLTLFFRPWGPSAEMDGGWVRQLRMATRERPREARNCVLPDIGRSGMETRWSRSGFGTLRGHGRGSNMGDQLAGSPTAYLRHLRAAPSGNRANWCVTGQCAADVLRRAWWCARGAGRQCRGIWHAAEMKLGLLSIQMRRGRKWASDRFPGGQCGGSQRPI